MRIAKSSFIALLLTIAVSIYWFTRDSDESKVNPYLTRALDRGDIIQTISANGTLTPVVLVNVGTQISGTVARLYADFNDEVETGQILAELDPALLQAQLQQSGANLLSAQTQHNITRSKLERHQRLYEQGFISAEGLDIVKQELDAARAQLAVSRAQVERDRANLSYSIIKSPISGVVIARDVDIGQTVAANFQTPVLFQIAKDLREMQINISVSEADIGLLHIGQPINFTVDAYQNRTFSGTVKQVRLNPTIQENVVTYNVVAMVSNDEGALLPGMTANIHFVVDQRRNVLRMPNAALRYQPDDAESAGSTGARVQKKSDGQVTVYQLIDGVRAVAYVATGITDGNYTEIVVSELKEGDAVIIRDKSGKKDSASQFRFRMF
ncbi:MAG: efflux RND transporter periplasmic adaptor subunit [Nitrosomonas sp.]|nr:efflux RND transporter periplasmic adaptor subunit [Nitrosomonas sp.]MCP5251757.1 efflux RND transporter periplasmic adaptor subunit [Burkholderiales bacterium]MCP5292097.1 efflux RND transporter periplasmic adaptor subunit [Burkholderiales bacterium]MCP5292965.1 efflux RND transporter periplasmic adaptor subunit [Burkholderiales bacterium]MDR4520125.1 efflux RND transporter periplasmic adaptor subunit [Nitrosomonas sp.]